jgi:hypothetical protein
LKAFAPPGATGDNTILLRVGADYKDVLAVKNPHRGVEVLIRARFRYTGNGISEELSPHVGMWPLQPFVNLVEAIRSWISEGPDRGHEVHYRMQDEDELSESNRILLQLVQAYCQAVNAVSHPQRERELSAVPTPSEGERARTIRGLLQTSYAVSKYDASVVLRLKQDGALAIDYDDDPFQLLLKLHMSRDKSGALARISVWPPDFLVSGGLRDAFISAISTDENLEMLADLLEIPTVHLEGFLHSLDWRTCIFRVRREREHDTNVLVLWGHLDGEWALVMLRARFEVHAARTPPAVKLIEDTIEALYRGDPHTTEQVLDGATVEYFLRLITLIKSWKSIL